MYLSKAGFGPPAVTALLCCVHNTVYEVFGMIYECCS